MSDIQVNFEPTNVITEAEMQNNQRVADFKELLTAIRLKWAAAAQERYTLYLQFKKDIESRNEIVSLLKTEAKAMYPELVLEDLKATLDRVAGAHPLNQLWGKYRSEIAKAHGKMMQSLKSYKDRVDGMKEAESEELKVLQVYQEFQAQASTPVPTADELAIEVDQVATIPQVDDADLSAQIPALELLDADTADMITLEAVSMISDEDLQTMTTMQASDQKLLEAVQGPKLTWKHWAGIAALAYLLTRK